jgi:hypothetical protein
LGLILVELQDGRQRQSSFAIDQAKLLEVQTALEEQMLQQTTAMCEGKDTLTQ